MYIGPDPLLPNSEIKQLYATLITDFHSPSPPSSQHTHGCHYHIYTGDFNSWTGSALENHLAHPPSHFPSRVGDPRPDHQPQDRTSNPQARKTDPKTRGRLLLDFLNPHSLIIGNGRFQNNLQPHIPTTKHDTIVDYFILSQIIMPDVQSCTVHLNSWHRLPAPPPPSTSPHPKHTTRTDHNILSLHLLLPVHPPLHSARQPKTHFPPDKPSTPGNSNIQRLRQYFRKTSKSQQLTFSHNSRHYLITPHTKLFNNEQTQPAN